jgi:O-antigen/teichoic acid export membrane protein
LSELRESDQRARLHQVCAALTRAILILSGGVACVVALVNEGFVDWWVGSAQYGGLALTFALIAGMLLRHWNMTTVYSLFALGHDKRISLTTLAQGVVTVAAGIVLTYEYGLVGAALSTVVGVVLVGLPANLTALARETSVRTARLLVDVAPWMWRFALVTAAAAALSLVWVPRTLPRLVAATLLAGAAYLAIMWPLGMREPLGIYIKPRLATLRRLVLREASSHVPEG